MPRTRVHIEVVAESSEPAKHKGDLLEALGRDLLVSQSFDVDQQLRVTGVELDLVAKHQVNARQIYVECKAHRDSLSADVLTKLLGTLDLHDEYEEAWLVTAGPLGKDAKGILANWQKKPADIRRRLTVFTPEALVDALINSGQIKSPDVLDIPPSLADMPAADEVILLVSVHGRFWAWPLLSGGIPQGVVVYAAADGSVCTDPQLLRRLATTDSSVKSLDHELVAKSAEPQSSSSKDTSPYSGQIIEVKQGDSWDDYRPARPEDFVGRDASQKRILRFLEAVRQGETQTRVLAVTGNTGMGKSSLIVKLRHRIRNKRHRARFFMYAVDVRAARGPQYVLRAVLQCLTEARRCGYGDGKGDLSIADMNDPLESPSLKAYIESLERQGIVVCLVLDQFEELYAKPELFAVFEQAERLFLSTASHMTNFVVGFVWRSDTTVPQDHPAYHMWHRLADHRSETHLRVFSPAETSQAISCFEKEVGQAIRPELRRQIAENCEGYPWLLKKLCIHLYEHIKDGRDQSQLTETMDVGALFAADLNACSQAELLCLEYVAKQAPADFFDVLECFGKDTIDSLQDKRLILRSGDRLNLYWDVFREYVLTKRVPPIPSTYLPSSPSIGAFLTIAARLDSEVSRSSESLAEETGLSVKTVGNVVHDLVMFGLARGSPSSVKRDPGFQESEEEPILARVREVFRRHALTRELQKIEPGLNVTLGDMIAALKAINPTAQHSPDTWEIYAKRLGPWLLSAGLLGHSTEGWVAGDQGAVSVPSKRGSRFRLGCFQADAPPAKVVAAHAWLKVNQPASYEAVKDSGYRNAVRVLDRFELTSRDEEGRYMCVHGELTATAMERLVYESAHDDDTLVEVLRYLESRPNASGKEIGHYISGRFQQPWNEASKGRNGNALRMWAGWIAEGEAKGTVPSAPGPRTRRLEAEARQEGLFGGKSPL